MGVTRKACSLLLLALLVLPLVACESGRQSTESGRVRVIEGQVFYRERMMLPPGAELEVQLQDISRPDALASVMASVLLTPEGGPPFPFAIEYDPSRIDSRMRYALRATIAVDGQMLFSSTEYIDPFSGGPTAGEPVEVLVRWAPEAVNSDQTR